MMLFWVIWNTWFNFTSEIFIEMAEKRRSGIPRLVSTTRSSNIGIESRFDDLRTIPSVPETKSITRKSYHAVKLDSLNEDYQMQTATSHQMGDITSNCRERKLVKTNGDKNECRKPPVIARDSVKTHSTRRMPPKYILPCFIWLWLPLQIYS